MDAWLTEQLLLHPFYKEAKTIATYLSFPHEFQTAELIEQAQKDGKTILIPKTYPQGKMDLVLYEPEKLEKILLVSLNLRGKLLSLNLLRLT